MLCFKVLGKGPWAISVAIRCTENRSCSRCDQLWVTFEDSGGLVGLACLLWCIRGNSIHWVPLFVALSLCTKTWHDSVLDEAISLSSRQRRRQTLMVEERIRREGNLNLFLGGVLR